MAEPAQNKVRNRKVQVLPFESVDEGNNFARKVVDEVCVRLPEHDVTCETTTNDNTVMAKIKIKPASKIDYNEVVRGLVAQKNRSLERCASTDRREHGLGVRIRKTQVEQSQSQCFSILICFNLCF